MSAEAEGEGSRWRNSYFQTEKDDVLSLHFSKVTWICMFFVFYITVFNMFVTNTEILIRRYVVVANKKMWWLATQRLHYGFMNLLLVGIDRLSG